MNVSIELKETSQPVDIADVTNTYTKGPLYCIYGAGIVVKFPLANIWRITEDYS